MSRDLQSRRALSEIQLPNINLSDNSRDESERCSSTKERAEIGTPESPQNLIPKILSCPPAPKKPKRVISCKRKLLGELEFFDVAAKEEVDSFFSSVDANSKYGGSSSSRKRRCLL